jgi:hypothetical protein
MGFDYSIMDNKDKDNTLAEKDRQYFLSKKIYEIFKTLGFIPLSSAKTEIDQKKETANILDHE